MNEDPPSLEEQFNELRGFNVSGINRGVSSGNLAGFFLGRMGWRAKAESLLERAQGDLVRQLGRIHEWLVENSGQEQMLVGDVNPTEHFEDESLEDGRDVSWKLSGEKGVIEAMQVTIQRERVPKWWISWDRGAGDLLPRELVYIEESGNTYALRFTRIGARLFSRTGERHLRLDEGSLFSVMTETPQKSTLSVEQRHEVAFRPEHISNRGVWISGR